MIPRTGSDAVDRQGQHERHLIASGALHIGGDVGKDLDPHDDLGVIGGTNNTEKIKPLSPG